MQGHQSGNSGLQAPRKVALDRGRVAHGRLPDVARAVLARVALVGFGLMSVLGLGGCRAVEAIFKVGVWFGVLIVVAIVAVVGGIAAMVMKKK